MLLVYFAFRSLFCDQLYVNPSNLLSSCGPLVAVDPLGGTAPRCYFDWRVPNILGGKDPESNCLVSDVMSIQNRIPAL
jgi:hypothetical protein